LRKRIDEWIVKDSPQANEGPKMAPDANTVARALLKAGAHYTGIAGKSEGFFWK
jgi:hypothetical protein